jgi:hypothetical protein
MMTAAQVSALLTSISTFLLALASGVAFVGLRRDVTSIQTAIMNSGNVTAENALQMAQNRILRRQIVFWVAWIVGLVCGLLAALVGYKVI